MKKKMKEQHYGFDNALLEFLMEEVGPDNYWLKTDVEDGGMRATLHVWGKQFEESDDE
tara:strand:- start:64 stop:237 length:174 start_codon:yes stop_codon:yes gene_type:complete